MTAPDLPWLGPRIREQRLRRGISLRALAREVGVSASMVSQIETGKSRPSVSTLYSITSVLGMSIEDVFSDIERAGAAPPVEAVSAARAVAQGAPLAAVAATATAAAGSATAGSTTAGSTTAGSAAADGRLGPLVHPAERQVLRLDSGVTWERLGELPGRTVDFLRITYAPGATSSSRGELMRHSGAEYGYLLSGELVLTLGFREIQLRPGDTVSFDSTTPHGYRNDGTEPAVGIWFVIED